MPELTESLQYAISRSGCILNYYQNRNINTIEEFCLTAINRIHQATIGLDVLLSATKRKSHVEYGAAILVRSLLSDSIFILNAYIKGVSGGDLSELNDFCFTALSDGIHHLIEDMKVVDSSVQKVNYSEIVNRYPDYVEEPDKEGSKPKMKIDPSKLKQLKHNKLIENIKADKNFEKYAGIYQTYLYYSKYDHFSLLFNDFQEAGIHEQLEKINNCIAIIPRLLMYITHLLCKNDLMNNNKENTFLKDMLTNLMHYNKASFNDKD